MLARTFGNYLLLQLVPARQLARSGERLGEHGHAVGACRRAPRRRGRARARASVARLTRSPRPPPPEACCTRLIHQEVLEALLQKLFLSGFCRQLEEMEEMGVDEVARWLVESVRLPQYEQAFRENQVHGDMLLDLVANQLLGHLVENPLHQSRIRSALARSVRRASSAVDAPEDGGEGEGASTLGRRRAAEVVLPDAERPRQRPRHGEPEAGVAAATAVLLSCCPAVLLVAVESPAHGVLVYARPPLADLEVRPTKPAASLPCLTTARRRRRVPPPASAQTRGRAVTKRRSA